MKAGDLVRHRQRPSDIGLVVSKTKILRVNDKGEDVLYVYVLWAAGGVGVDVSLCDRLASVNKAV